MATSLAAVFTSHEAPIELRKIPIPALSAGEILVKNEYTTLCRSDLNTYCGKRFEPTPTILGHEIVGRIAAFGQATTPRDLRNTQLQVGDRISWAIFASNPNCALSRQGIPQKGEGLFKYGHEQLSETSVLHGGLAQYTILRPHTPIVKVDETVPLKIAAIINCAVATVAGALRLAGDLQDKNVLVSGVGMLGMIACAMAKTRGVSSVAALDIDPSRLTLGQQYGADLMFLSGEGLEEVLASAYQKKNPFHVLIELSGVPATVEKTLEFLDIGGTAVWVGATYPAREVQISAEKIVRNLLTIKGLHNYNETDFLMAIEFIEQFHQNFPFADMIHDHFSLEQVNEAFEYGLSANPFRVGLRIH